MALDKHKEYLAAKVLNDGVPVNYRLLSRALKINTNVAKQLLYEFHRSQTARKPGAVHATYLITGIQKPQPVGGSQSGGDMVMSDGPLMSSSLPEPSAEQSEDDGDEVRTLTMTLVQEENLKDVKATYDEVHAIHVYSLEPSTLQNVHVLSDCSRQVIAETSTEDPLTTWEKYGTIRNPAAKRRAGGRAAPVQPAAPPKTAAMKPEPKKTSDTRSATSAETVKPADTARPESGAKGAGAAKPAKAAPPGPKRESSDLFKSFAKTPAPAPKPMDAEDVEDEGPLEETPEAKAKAEVSREASRVARKAQDEQLRKMMEDDQDSPMGGTGSDSDADDRVGSEAGNEGGGEEDADVEMAEAAPAVVEAAPQVTTENGRRRGRRRVMKKKTTKDAEGYLVTKQEEAWESFSEEEPAAKPPPRTSTPAGTGKAAAKNSGSGGAKGQGSIMSFFGKK